MSKRKKRTRSKIDFTARPLLELQAGLLRLPRDRRRFQVYVQEVTGGKDALELPLSLFNPMAKEHVLPLVEGWLGLGAEARLEEHVDRASRELDTLAFAVGPYRVGLVMVDDAQGGWTHREQTEIKHWFQLGGEHHYGWAPILLFTSEEPCLELLRRRVRSGLYRVAELERDGAPRDLGGQLLLEGRARAFAGYPLDGCLDGEALVARLEPHLHATDLPTQFAVLFGDEKAEEMGYRPLGFNRREALDAALWRATSECP